MAQSDHLFHLCRRLTTFLIEYGAYIWHTVYQREDYGFYEHRRAERIARPKVFLFKQRRKPVRVFFISTDDRRATSLVCFVRGCAALPLSEIFSQHCTRKPHALSAETFRAELRHMGSMCYQSTAMQNRFISDAQSTWVACVAKAPPCSTDSLSMREELPQHLHD